MFLSFSPLHYLDLPSIHEFCPAQASLTWGPAAPRSPGRPGFPASPCWGHADAQSYQVKPNWLADDSKSVFFSCSSFFTHIITILSRGTGGATRTHGTLEKTINEWICTANAPSHKMCNIFCVSQQETQLQQQEVVIYFERS